jgi:hypothetical protein
LIGDPLDVKMFEATNWVLEEPSNEAKIDELVLAYVKPSIAGRKDNFRADSMLSNDVTSSNGGAPNNNY